MIIPDAKLTQPIDLGELDNATLLEIYFRMSLAREFEEKLYYLFLTRPMPGTMHQATGQEGVAVGVVSALHADDYITSTHRGHCHCIAKGVPVKEMMAEMFARSTGSCGGMGGSMHLADFEKGMLGAFAIVGAGIPIATGAAFSALVRKSGQVAVSFFGDGAINEGVFHESLNMASLWKLPVIYVIENNQYAFSMTVERSSAVTDLYTRSSSYNIPGVQLDGNDVVAVHNAAKTAVERARNGGGPTLLECITYRVRGHARFENSAYRDPAEVEAWKKTDPIERLSQALIQNKIVSIEGLEEIQNRVQNELDEAIQFAENSPEPLPEDYERYVTDEVNHA